MGQLGQPGRATKDEDGMTTAAQVGKAATRGFSDGPWRTRTSNLGIKSQLFARFWRRYGRLSSPEVSQDRIRIAGLGTRLGTRYVGTMPKLRPRATSRSRSGRTSSSACCGASHLRGARRKNAASRQLTHADRRGVSRPRHRDREAPAIADSSSTERTRQLWRELSGKRSPGRTPVPRRARREGGYSHAIALTSATSLGSRFA